MAGLFFLAAALALVGFLGLFFAMAHVRLVIPLALGAKVPRARVTELPNVARAATASVSKTLAISSLGCSRGPIRLLIDTRLETVLLYCD